jgi:hypothetical protein
MFYHRAPVKRSIGRPPNLALIWDFANLPQHPSSHFHHGFLYPKRARYRRSFSECRALRAATWSAQRVLREWIRPMTTLDSGITHLPPLRKRSVTAFAAAAMAVAAFVAISLALKSMAHMALVATGLVEDAFGQCTEYVVVTALSMGLVRRLLDAASLRYGGRTIFIVFLSISVLVMAFALSSGMMKVDLLISLLQMSALCVSAYLQFWTRDGRGRPERA